MNPFIKSGLMVCLVSSGIAHAEDAWKSYVNSRFGYELKYPAELVPEVEPENGIATGSRVFRQGKGVLLQTNAHFLHGSSLDKQYAEALQRYGDSVTYKLKKEGWFVVSGVKDGEEYYYKFFVQQDNWVSIYFKYPASESAKWNPVVEKATREFRPFLNGDFERGGN